MTLAEVNPHCNHRQAEYLFLFLLGCSPKSGNKEDNNYKTIYVYIYIFLIQLDLFSRL